MDAFKENIFETFLIYFCSMIFTRIYRDFDFIMDFSHRWYTRCEMLQIVKAVLRIISFIIIDRCRYS